MEKGYNQRGLLPLEIINSRNNLRRFRRGVLALWQLTSDAGLRGEEIFTRAALTLACEYQADWIK